MRRACVPSLLLALAGCASARPSAAYVAASSPAEPCALDASLAQPPGLLLRNEMQSYFTLTRLELELDGARVRSLSWPLPEGPEELAVPELALAPGRHRLEVRAQLGGWPRFGIFSYVRNYRFDLRGAYDLEVSAGRAASVRVTLVARGGPTTPPEERPAMRCRWGLR